MHSRRNFLRGAVATGATVFGVGVGSVGVGVITEKLLLGSDGSVLWPFNAPVLDQGSVGSCTGNAVAQWLNTDYAMEASKRSIYMTQNDALEIYTAATMFDNPVFPGEYPVKDTGSTGDFACVGAIQLGFLSGFRRIHPDLEHMWAALKEQPLIVGSGWTEDMYNPDANGFLNTAGEPIGGHEYLLLGYNVPGDYFIFLNSWSENWGIKGRFKVRSADYVKLLDGDASAVVSPFPANSLT